VIDAARRVSRTHRRELAFGVAVASAAVLVAGDPHRAHALAPRCPVKLLTGLDCPACGGLRLTHDLVHGDVRAAVHDNAFLLLSGPLLAAIAWRGVAAERPGGLEPVPPRVAYALAAGAMVWMLVRNLPGWRLRPIVRD